jgi:hypothetical protein
MHEPLDDYKFPTKILFFTGRMPFSQAKKIHPVLGIEAGWKG